jgi:hypothetical protein
MPVLSPQLRDYVDLVVNPIAASRPAQVPDLTQFNSLCFSDTVDLHAPSSDATQPIYGALIYLSCNFSDFNAGYSTNNGFTYRVHICGLDSASALQANAGGTFQAFRGVNQTSLIGATLQTSLVDQLRMIAAGLRVLPVIEKVTDPTQNYLSIVAGGQLSPAELVAAQINSTPILPMVKTSPCAEVFSNSQGCTARYDPCQSDWQLEMLSYNKLLDNDKAFDNFKFPAIAVMFSAQVANLQSMPFIVHAQFWLEGVIRQPSPIYAQQSPVDTSWEQARAVLSQCSEEFPMVVSGHSFLSLLEIVPLFISAARRIVRSSSSLFLAATDFGSRPQREIKQNVARARITKKKKNRNNVRRGNGQRPTSRAKPTPRNYRR